MTIRKGEEWGTRIVAPDDLILLPDDAHLAQLNADAIGVLIGGDIHHTLGSPPPVLSGADCTQLEIDAMQVLITLMDGEQFILLASSRVEIGSFRPSLLMRKRYVCVTNGGIVDTRNLAPRAHPNDGVIDCLKISEDMSLRIRLTAMKKARSGTHVPHPQISVSRSDCYSFQQEFARETLSVDGVTIPGWSSVSVTVLPDYWKIVV